MEEITYKQDSRLSRDTLTLEEDRLTVSTNALGLKREQVIKFRDIASDYEYENRRFYSLLIGPIVIASVTVFAIQKLLALDSVFKLFVAIPIVGLATCLVRIFRALRPIEVTLFRNRDGDVVVEIFRPRSGIVAYQKFVAALRDRIKANDNNAPAK